MTTVAPGAAGSDPLEHHASRVAGTLRRVGLVSRAEALAAELDAARQQSALTAPVVVVAGEEKRGKSSLVNALLGRPGVSPVGLDVVTSAPLTFHYSVQETAEVTWYGTDETSVVGLAEACALSTVDGSASQDRAVRAVRIGLPSPFLRELDLVDTPGVGGLDSGHAALTLQSLAQADALVFVLEAGAQIRGPELAFLRQAAARIESVFLVVTKVDSFRGYRTILEDNLAILREQAPRFAGCPVLPVSAALALRGLRSGDPSDADAMAVESGVTALSSALTEQVVERRSVLARANLVRAGLSALSVAEQGLSERLQALSPDDDARRALRIEQERLARLRDDKANWPRLLDLEIRKLTIDQSDDLARGISDIRRRYDARIKKSAPGDTKTLPGELVADLAAMAGRLGEMAATRLNEVVVQLMAEVDASDGLEESLDQLTRGAIEADTARLDLGGRPFSVSDRLSVLSGFSSGHSLASLIVGSGGMLTAGILSGPFAILLGVGLGGFYAFENFRSKRKQLQASELTSWVNDQCQEAQRAIKSNFARALIDIQENLKSRIKQALAECEADVAESLAAAKATLDAGEAVRQRARARIEEARSEINALSSEATRLLASLGPQPAPNRAPDAPPAESIL